MITVYTRSGCSACVATKLWLKRERIEFEELDADGSIVVASLGHTMLPVVVDHNGGHWSGFKIDKLAALKTHHGGSNSGVIGS